MSDDFSRKVDPGNEVAEKKASELARIIDWVERHPATTLMSGEGKLLVSEIKRLKEELREIDERNFNEGVEQNLAE